MSESLISPSPVSLGDLPVLILAGGLGTRLRNVLPDRPKCLAEILGRPFLRYQLDALEFAGFRRVVLCTGYMADLVYREIGNSHGGLQVTYSREEIPLGTGGSVRLALERNPCEVCLVLNGDSWCDLDYGELPAKYLKNRAPIMVLNEVEDTTRYGRVEVDNFGTITGFAEKGLSGRGWINAGVYLIPGNSLHRFSANHPLSLERDLFPGWAVERRLQSHKSYGRFIDIGTPESLQEASIVFGNGIAKDLRMASRK